MFTNVWEQGIVIALIIMVIGLFIAVRFISSLYVGARNALSLRNLDRLSDRFRYDLRLQTLEVLHYLGGLSIPDLYANPEVLDDDGSQIFPNITGAWAWVYDQREGSSLANKSECFWLSDLMCDRATWLLRARDHPLHPAAVVVQYGDKKSPSHYYAVIGSDWTVEINTPKGEPDACQIHHLASGLEVTYRFEDNAWGERIHALLKFMVSHHQTDPAEMKVTVLDRFKRDIEKNHEEFGWIPSVIDAMDRARKIKDILNELGHNPSTKDILDYLEIREETSIPKDFHQVKESNQTEEAHEPH